MYINLFKTFFKIGIVTFGGGYAIIPMIEEDVVRRNKWVSKDEFIDLLAIAQTCPGVFAINISTFIGYKIKKFQVQSAQPWELLYPLYHHSSHCHVLPSVSK